MNIKEIRLERDLIEKTRKTGQERYEKELERLNKEEEKAKDNLKKTILKHFKGIIPDVNFIESNLKVKFNDKMLLTLTYKEFKFDNITKELAKEIVNDYKKVYGEVREEQQMYSLNWPTGASTSYVPYITSAYSSSEEE